MKLKKQVVLNRMCQVVSWFINDCVEFYVLFCFILAPLVMHTQTMNGLRRSFLCRVKKSSSPKTTQNSSTSPTPDIDCNNSENVIKLLQSTQQCIPYQYAVLYCTGFIRYMCMILDVKYCSIQLCAKYFVCSIVTSLSTVFPA